MTGPRPRSRFLFTLLAAALAACTHGTLTLGGDGSGTPTAAPSSPPLTPTPTPTPIPCNGSGSICGFGFDRNGDGSNALLARFVTVPTIATDAAGNVWIPDAGGARLRRIDPAGTITTVVGTGLHGFPNTTGVAALAADLDQPSVVAVDGNGALFWADWDDQKIYTVGTASGLVQLVAGGGPNAGGNPPNGVPPTSASFQMNGQGNLSAGPLPGELVIADVGRNLIRVANVGTAAIVVAGVTVAPDSIQTVAGKGGFGFPPQLGNGGPALSSELTNPDHALATVNGTLYIADTADSVLEVVNPQGIIEAVTGGGYGEKGDGGPASAGQLEYPGGLALSGNALFTCDAYDNVCKVVNLSSTEALSFAGSTVGPSDLALVFGGYGLGSLSGALEPAEPNPLLVSMGTDFSPPAVLPDGDLLVLDWNRGLIRRLDHVTGLASIFAGQGTDTPSQSMLAVNSVATDGSGALLALSPYSLRLLQLSSDGTRTVVAGNGATTTGGDGGPLLSAGFIGQSMTPAGAHTVLVADSINHVLRMVNTSGGVISTVAGRAGDSAGNIGSGSGGTPDQITFSDSGPSSSALDTAGNLFVLDGGQVWAAALSGSELRFGYFATVAPGSMAVVAISAGTVGYQGDGQTANAAQFDLATGANPSGLAADGTALYVADTHNQVIRRIQRSSGIVTTFAGTGDYGSSGDGGAASSATLANPTNLVLALGRLYWSEDGGVRYVDLATGLVTRVAGDGNIGDYGDGGIAASAEIQANGIAVAADGTVYIAGGGRIRMVLP